MLCYEVHTRRLLYQVRRFNFPREPIFPPRTTPILHSVLSGCSAEDDPPDSCYTEIIKYVAHVARRARRRVVRTIRQPTLVRRIEATLGRRRKNDPDIDVETVDRHGAGNRRRRRHDDSAGDDDDADGAQESRRLSPPAVSTAVGSPRAPRASPEPSVIDPISSPRWPRRFFVTPPGSAGGSPPLGAASSLAVIRRCRSAEQQDTADLDYYNSLHLTHAKKGRHCSFQTEILAYILKLFHFCKSDVSAVQGHTRSLSLVPIESAYVTISPS